MDKKWQAYQSSKVVQKGPKWSSWVIFDHLGPFWAYLDPFGPFQTKMNLLPQMNKVGFSWGASEQKNHFLFEMVKKGPDGSKGVQNGQKHLCWCLDLFGPFWITLEHWQACHIWPFLVQNGPFFCHPLQPLTLDPNVKKGSSPGLLCMACLETPKHAISEIWPFCPGNGCCPKNT